MNQSQFAEYVVDMLNKIFAKVKELETRIESLEHGRVGEICEQNELDEMRNDD